MARLFAMGVIILFLGLQLRAVDTFILNEKATEIVNRRIDKQAATTAPDPYNASIDPYSGVPSPKEVSFPAKREITPPRWLGYSFLSIGAVLVLTCPLFR